MIDSFGFGSRKSVILLEALGGTKDEQISPGDFPQIKRTLASYTHGTQETTQDTLLDTQIIAEREVKLQ